MDERRVDELVHAIVAELSAAPAAVDGGRADQGGFFLVDRWRVWEDHKREFLDLYRAHVVAVVRRLAGFRRCLTLTSPPNLRPAWQLEALFEFASDDILDRFHDDFAREYRRAFPNRSVDDLLRELEPWVLAHEDSTMVWLPS
jgi:hypothetical protein